MRQVAMEIREVVTYLEDARWALGDGLLASQMEDVTFKK